MQQSSNRVFYMQLHVTLKWHNQIRKELRYNAFVMNLYIIILQNQIFLLKDYVSQCINDEVINE